MYTTTTSLEDSDQARKIASSNEAISYINWMNTSILSNNPSASMIALY